MRGLEKGQKAKRDDMAMAELVKAFFLPPSTVDGRRVRPLAALEAWMDVILLVRPFLILWRPPRRLSPRASSIPRSHPLHPSARSPKNLEGLVG